MVLVSHWKNMDLQHIEMLSYDGHDDPYYVAKEYNEKNFRQNEKHTSYAEVIPVGKKIELYRDSNGEVHNVW